MSARARVDVEDIMSEANCELSFLLKKFKNKACDFITVNPHKKGKKFASLQKIGRVSDWFRRHCDEYFIVREHNSDGSNHYHIIASKFDGSVMKCVNQLVKPIGARAPPSFINEEYPGETKTYRYQEFQSRTTEVEDVVRHFFGMTRPQFANQITAFLFSLKEKQLSRKRYQKRKVTLQQRATDLQRVIQYCLKDNPINLYQDYIIR